MDACLVCAIITVILCVRVGTYAQIFMSLHVLSNTCAHMITLMGKAEASH